MLHLRRHTHENRIDTRRADPDTDAAIKLYGIDAHLHAIRAKSGLNRLYLAMALHLGEADKAAAASTPSAPRSRRCSPPKP